MKSSEISRSFVSNTNSETSSLSADPKMHLPTAFRCARQGIHDAVIGGTYAARIAKERGLKRWMDVFAGLRLWPGQHGGVS